MQPPLVPADRGVRQKSDFGVHFGVLVFLWQKGACHQSTKTRNPTKNTNEKSALLNLLRGLRQAQPTNFTPKPEA